MDGTTVQPPQVEADPPEGSVSALECRFDPRLPEPLIAPDLVQSGGPPPDGIPPIDAPTFESAGRDHPSGVTFLRELDSRVLSFGTSGMLYADNLVMYHRQTESLWLQLAGRASNGVLTGEKLESIPMGTVAWGEFRGAHPTDVLGRAVAGPLKGAQLTPVEHLDTFWFAWVTFHPDTELINPDVHGDER